MYTMSTPFRDYCAECNCKLDALDPAPLCVACSECERGEAENGVEPDGGDTPDPDPGAITGADAWLPRKPIRKASPMQSNAFLRSLSTRPGRASK